MLDKRSLFRELADYPAILTQYHQAAGILGQSRQYLKPGMLGRRRPDARTIASPPAGLGQQICERLNRHARRFVHQKGGRCDRLQFRLGVEFDTLTGAHAGLRGGDAQAIDLNPAIGDVLLGFPARTRHPRRNDFGQTKGFSGRRRRYGSIHGVILLAASQGRARYYSDMKNAYVVGQITIKNPQRWAEYRSQVPATLVPWGGELVFRGTKVAEWAGENRHPETVVIRFPSLEAAQGWFESPAYQWLIPLRQQAADVDLLVYDNQPTTKASDTPLTSTAVQDRKE